MPDEKKKEPEVLTRADVVVIVLTFIAVAAMILYPQSRPATEHVDFDAQMRSSIDNLKKLSVEFDENARKTQADFLKSIEKGARTMRARQLYKAIIDAWRYSCASNSSFASTMLNPVCAEWNAILTETSDPALCCEDVIAARNATVPTTDYYQRDDTSLRVLLAMTPLSPDERNTNATCTNATLRAVAAECFNR